MQSVINIFTIIGSILGTIAFLISIFQSTSSHNSTLWQGLSSLIKIGDLDTIARDVSIGIVHKEEYGRLRNLVYVINQDLEELNFKGMSGKRIRKELFSIEHSFRKLQKIIQAPNWDIVKTSLEHIEYQINKQYFYKENTTTFSAEKK